MARFDLSKYATVAERIQVLYSEYPDARIVTENLTTVADRSVSTWVVKASLYLTAGDQANSIPKATGHAFEIDGGPGANSTSALENAESSAVGRCLALAGWSGNKESTSLASRDEMDKVTRGVTPKAPRDFLKEAEGILSVTKMRDLYSEAFAANADADVLDKLKHYGQALSVTSEG